MADTANPTLVITGGHHTSAMPLIPLFKKRGINLVWFGHRHSMWLDRMDSAEYKEISDQQIPFVDIQAGKFYNTLNPLKLIRIPWGFLQAFLFLHKYKPQGILSFGGYLAVPTVICGWLLGIPSVTHEQTIVAGLANKLISLFVKKIAISWPQSHKHFPPAKVVFTGLPIRKEVLKIISNKKKITKTPAIYVTGGKQGSHVINQATFPLVPELSKNFTIIHQTGSTSLNSDYEQAIELSKIYPNYHPFDYDSQKAASALSEASVVVSRSGAHITYELGILGIRCVLIPLPNSSHSEQELNAKSLEKSHQAIILSQDQLSPKSLHNAILSASKLNPEPINLPIDADNKLFQLIIDTLPI